MAPPSAPNDELLSTILFLINNHYWCALYELYVDARRLNVLDADLPSLNTLKSFFNDSKRFPDGVFRAVNDAFDSGVSAARVVDAESRAAVAEYELRCAREDLQNSRRGAGGGGGEDGGEDASGASVRRGVDADDAFAPTSGDSARSSADDVGLDAKLDAATYEYLSRRGYKATALSMRDESSTAAKLMEKDFASDGERSFGALRRMYERARMTETTASALESERARVDDVESELIRARARIDELERENTTTTTLRDALSSKLALAESELSDLKVSAAQWEKKATESASEVNRLLSELGAGNEEWSSRDGNGVPRTTIEENDTIDAVLSFICAIAPKVSPAARKELLPMISRACVRAAGDEKRAARSSNLFFELFKAPNAEQRDAIVDAIANVGEIVGMNAFEGTFIRGCLGSEAVATMNEERRVLVLDAIAKLGASSWFTLNNFVMDGFKRAAVDPSDGVRAECSRAVERYIAANAPSDDNMETIEDVLMTLACDGSDEVADAARATLAPAVASWYLGANPRRFTDVFARKVLDKAAEALRSGWTGEGAEREFKGWVSPEDGDRHRWHATSLVKTFEAFARPIREALSATKPASIADGVDDALSKDAPDSWPFAQWCVKEASDLIVQVISSTAPDVVGQESVRESICAAVASWCGVLGALATRAVLIGKVNDACLVSYDQRRAVMPILLAGVVPYTPDGGAVLGDYIKRLIQQASAESCDEIIDAARYLAAFEQHTANLLDALKRCAHPIAENPPTVRLITARLLAATSEILPLKHVLEHVYPALNVLRADPETSVRRETALALAVCACTHYETIEPTTQTMRQLESLIGDSDVGVRVAVVEAMSLGASVPGTSFAVSAASALSAIAQLPSEEHEIAHALFAAIRDMLGADGDLFPQISPALVALLASGGLDQGRRAQVETMLRDGGWSPDTAPSSITNVTVDAPHAPGRGRSSAFDRMKSVGRSAFGGRARDAR